MAFFPIRNDLRKLRIVTIAQKDGTGIGVAGIHMTDAIRFFIGTGQFVFFDDIVQIIVYGSASDKTGLASSVHGLTVNVETGLGVLYTDAVCHQFVHILFGFFIDRSIVQVHVFRQIHFRLVHMQERIRIVLYLDTRFRAAHYVVR